MTTEATDVSTAKTKKPRSTKPATTKDVPKDKVTICLDAKDNFRLSIHAAGMRMDKSELVAKLIRENLKRFVVSDHGERPDSTLTSGEIGTEAAA